MNLAQYFVKRDISFRYENHVYYIYFGQVLIKMRDTTYPYGFIGEIIYSAYDNGDRILLIPNVTLTYNKVMVTLKQLNRIVKLLRFRGKQL